MATFRHAHKIAAILIALHAFFLLTAAAPSTNLFSPLSPQIKGPTFDEYFYISAGVSYLKTGDFSENREHPPLTKMMTAAPVAVQTDIDFPDHWRDLLHFPVQFFYEHNTESQARNLYLARLPVVFLALALDVVLYLVACGIAASSWAGLTALSLAAFDPSCIAAASTANLDFPAAAFGFFALAAVRRALLKNTFGSTAIAGIALGAAMLAKWTSLLLGPALLGMALAQAVSNKSYKPLLQFILIAAGAFSTFALGYGFETRSLDSVKNHPKYTARSKKADGTPNILERPIIAGPVQAVFGEHRGVPLLTSIKGLDHTLSETGQIGHAGYLLGETTPTLMKKDAATGREFPAFIGWKSYYLAVIPQKLPVTSLLLILCGIVAALWPGKSWLDRIFLLVFPATTILQFTFSNAQLGIKYILPALFPLFVCAGLLATRVRIGIVIFAVAFLGAAQATIRMHPSEAMFSSILAGGSESGPRVACVGDDWGQDAPGLAQFAKDLLALTHFDHNETATQSFLKKYKSCFADDININNWQLLKNVRHALGQTGLAYRYYGEGEPKDYGYDFDVLGVGPRRGVVAVHSTTLYRENEQFSWLERYDKTASEGEPMPGIYRWFEPGRWIVNHRPFAKIGQAIYVYYIP
ncbi:MAG: phospholipid carrier-dependent glycosyltransferase [Planctomycetota bacterium]